MLRSPKERFIATTHAGAWGKLTNGEMFDDAVHAALAQLATELPMECPVPQHAADAHQQMIGARKYMEILSTLHSPETTPTPKQPRGLDYTAGV
jgi:hypothetical protein